MKLVASHRVYHQKGKFIADFFSFFYRACPVEAGEKVDGEPLLGPAGAAGSAMLKLPSATSVEADDGGKLLSGNRRAGNNPGG